MSVRSRFDKLESKREDKPTTSTPSPREGRFGAEPPPIPTEASAPDTSDPLPLDERSLARMPVLRCPRCRQDSSKFDQQCIHCGHSLTSPEAIQLNLTLLAERDAEAEAIRAAQRTSQEAQISALIEETVQAAGERERIGRESHRWTLRLALGLTGAICVGLGVWVQSFCLTLAFLAAGLSLVVAALPQRVREILVKRYDRS